MKPFLFECLETPAGSIDLVSHGGLLCALDFSDRRWLLRQRLERRYGAGALREHRDPAGHATRLAAYFDGDLDALEGIRVETGGSDFQRRVWAALRRVPPGETRSYGAIAAAIDRPGAARAVGAANARNPIALVVPCHRVVTAGSGPGGYAGGPDRKRWLLRHEGVAGV